MKPFKSLLGTGILAALASSLCCITPVLALLGGVSGVAATFSWIEPFRPYFTGITIALFGFAWYRQLTPKKNQPNCACDENRPSFWQSKIFLGIMTVLAALLLSFPYYSYIFSPEKPPLSKNTTASQQVQQVQLTIEGMTCTGCEEHINAELSKVTGILEYATSYKEGKSSVKFDKNTVSADSIIRAVNATGYTVTNHVFIHQQ